MDPKKLDITSGNGLRLLSFDGGGARALSQIKIVENIIDRVNAAAGEDEESRVVLPCKCFDLIGGSDTGGVLAVMLGKLSMTVQEAYIEFNKIHHEVYAKNHSAENRTKRLRDCIEDLLRRRGFPIDLKLRGEGGCPCFVVATPKSSLQSKVKLRSYDARADFSTDITVVEAVLATCATQPVFTPVSIGSGIISQELIGGTIGLANPSQELITEAQAKFDSKEKVSVILSIGAGHPGALAAPSSSTEQWTEVLWRMVTNSEQIAQDMENRLGGEGIYFRFSVNQAFPNHHGAIDDPALFNTFTQDYLDNEEVAERLHQCVEALRLRLTIVGLEQLSGLRDLDIGRVADVHALMEEKKGNKVLEGLKPQEMKPLPLPDACMEGTRQDILQEIEKWVSDDSDLNVLWVIGHPGVGKSAIASTVVNKLRRSKRLGGSFFFQRAYASISSADALWRTVAFDLAKGYQSIRRHLVTKLEADPDMLTTGSVDDLFHQLIYEPLVASNNIPTKWLPVVVIDALDECGGLDGQYSRHRKNVLRTLAKWFSLPKWFKLIVTSRSEQDIGCVLRGNSYVIEISAGPKVSPQSSEDIKAFLAARFQRITDEYATLAPNWPGDQLIQQLTKRAGGLFIWARTVIEFIDRGEPERQLDYIMEGEDTVGDMGTLYSQILQISFQDPTAKVMNAFHAILGAIIFLRRPLPATSVAQLLSIEGTRMQHICNKLKAVVDIEDVLKIYHQTFIEFLLDSNACPSVFYIRKEEEETRLVQACFQTMKCGLKFNICDIGSSYVLNSEIEDLDDRIQRKIPQELSYSSRHWATHLQACKRDIDMAEDVHRFMKVEFLYWLELLSLIKEVNAAAGILSSLVNWMKEKGMSYETAVDLHKFTGTFMNIISQSISHIYISALPFAPRTSEISKRYMPLYPNSLRIKTGGLERWPIAQNVMYGHGKEVHSVHFSPDGHRIVSGSLDNTLRVWDVETGLTVVGPLKGHTYRVQTVTFSPDGQRIASGSWDDTVRVWDSLTGELVSGPFEGHKKGLNSVAFSPDGRRVISVSNDSAIKVWDINTGSSVTGFFIGRTGSSIGHTKWLGAVCFSPDGQRIASASEDYIIRMWDIETGEMAAESFKGNTGRISSLAFSPDGERIISGSYDKTLRVWNAKTEHIIVGPLEGHTDCVLSVAFSPDGYRVASGSRDKTVRIWDVETGGMIAGPLMGHTAYVGSVAFSPDGLHVVSGSTDGTVRVWGVDTSELIREQPQVHTDYINSVAFSPDGSRIISGSADHTIRIWDTQTGAATMNPLYGNGVEVNSVAFSPDGKRIVSGSVDCTIKLWDEVGGEMVARSFKGHTEEVSCVAFSPNGERVVSGSRDGTVIVWDATTGNIVSGPCSGTRHWIMSVGFSRDGERIVSGAYDNTLRIWDADTGTLIAGPLEEHTKAICSVTFSPNGNQVISGSLDGTIRLWTLGENDVSSRLLFTGQTSPIYTITLSLDGRWIVSGSHDATVRVWDIEAGGIIHRSFRGHTRPIRSVALSPDGQWIASGSPDDTIRVWKMRPSTEDNSLLTSSSRLNEGWLLDSEDRRLFWAPPSLHDGLLRPGAELIIGNMIKTRLKFDSFVYGENWTSCRGSSSRAP